MAMTLDSAAQSALPAEIDYDMVPEQEAHDADFDIDIELDGNNQDDDVEVQDISQHEAGDLHYNDEIMHEGTRADSEYEMWEEQERQEADQDMDDTVYHEADSHLIDEGLNEGDNIDFEIQDTDQSVVSEARGGHTGETSDHDYDALDGNEVLSKPLESTKAESVATSVTMDALAGEQETNEPVDSNAAASQAQHDDEEEEQDDESHGENVEISEAGLRDVDASHTDEAVIASLDDHQGAPDHELSHNERTKNSATDVSHDEEDAETQSIGIFTGQGLNVNNIEGFEEEPSDDGMYNAKVQFQGQTVQLFPDESSENYEACLLQDVSLAERPVVELLSACRAQLANAVHADQILGVEVRGLQLIILETDDDCSEITLSQIIDVYHHLCSNDEVYGPEQLLLELTLRSRPLNRLNELFQAAEAGKGYSVLERMHEEDGGANDDEEEVYGSSEEPSDLLADNGLADDEGEVAGDEDGQAATTDFVGDKLGAIHNLPTGIVAQQDDAPAFSEEHSHSANENAAQDHAIKADDVNEPAEDFEADDLIDYSDDEEAEERNKGLSALANEDVPGRESAQAAITSTAEPKSDPANEELFETFTIQAESLVANPLEDGASSIMPNDALINPIAEHETTEQDLVANDDDIIDFGFGAATEERLDNEDPRDKPASPSGKRTWAEHAADEVTAPAVQDPKRVRSDG